MSNNLFLSTVLGSTSNGNVITTTYANLINLINTNNLVLGAIYQFDFLLKFNMQGTAGEFTADNTEVIQVLAIATNKISNKAYSVTYNENVIYDLDNLNIYGVSTVNSTGYISCRFLESDNTQYVDQFKNYWVNFDFRNQYFYKYATGTNLTGFTNVDNATAFIKYFSITSIKNSRIGFCQNIEFVSLENVNYNEITNVSYNYRYILAINSELNIRGDGFFKINSTNDNYFDITLTNVLITSNKNTFKDSTIDNCNFTLILNSVLNNSALQNCVSTYFTINAINSTIQNALNCYSLTYFDLNGQGIFFNNQDIVKSNSIVRYLKFDSSGVEFVAKIGQGTVVGVYPIFYMPSNFYTLDDIFIGIPDSANGSLGAVYNLGNNVTNNNLTVNQTENNLIVTNTNQNIGTPIKINTQGLLNLEILVANCNNLIVFAYKFRTNS